MSVSTAVISNDPFQNFTNNVAHKLYSAHSAICGLCSTDSKIYGLIILGRLLQTAAIVGFTASIAFVFFSGPLCFLGTIPAIALAILGSAAAESPWQVNAFFQMGRPFVPGQPIGLVNSGTNCWLNSSLQILANSPTYHARLRRIPEFAQFLDNYAKAETDYQKVAQSINPQTLREFLSRETNGDIALLGRQEDAAQVFETLFQGQEALHTFEQLTNAAPSAPRQEPMIQIDLGPQEQRPSFQELFNAFLDHHTDAGQHIQLFFQDVPDDLLFQIKRFRQTVDSTGRMRLEKILDPFDVPQNISIPNHFVISNEASQHQIDSFIVHYGNSLDVGHYVAYVKKGTAWWYCSDSHVTEISEQDAMRELKHSIFCHFKKVNPVP
jgi:hypothetical protein